MNTNRHEWGQRNWVWLALDFGYAIFFWADHAAKEAKVVEIRSADK